MLWALLDDNLVHVCWLCRLVSGNVPPSERCLRPLLAACCSSQVSAQDRNGQHYAAMCQMLICCGHA